MSGQVLDFPRRDLVDPREVTARAVLAAIAARGADHTDAAIREAAHQVKVIRVLRDERGDIADEDPLWELLDEARRLIIEMPAHTVAGVVIKLRFLAELDELDLSAKDDHRAVLLGSSLEALEAMDGDGRAA